ncbi:hypothetical protein F0562_022995 [Nyssa sinensis]|uniref:Uncharacterized protein n=1 Tax=Nyssa sinensis TaxID=561372 RepID=A0A5J5BFB9_9ASTE|nr:hypothetical protein F0562_022995 [Nyssa sinensis]
MLEELTFLSIYRLMLVDISAGSLQRPAQSPVCQNTNLPMISRPRKSASSSGNMKKQQNVRSYNTNNMLAFHRFSNLDKDMPRYGQDQTHQCMVLNPVMTQQINFDEFWQFEEPGNLHRCTQHNSDAKDDDLHS